MGVVLFALGMVSPGTEYWFPCFPKDGLCLLLVFFPECLLSRGKAGLCPTVAKDLVRTVAESFPSCLLMWTAGSDCCLHQVFCGAFRSRNTLFCKLEQNTGCMLK